MAGPRSHGQKVVALVLEGSLCDTGCSKEKVEALISGVRSLQCGEGSPSKGLHVGSTY
jgi:hypothetical protein